MFDPTEKDTLISCPFNKAHQILKGRMQTHLVKCGRNYPNLKAKTCPFNNTHIVLENEFRYHVDNCSDRGKLDAIVHKPEPTASSKFSFIHPEPIECSENWDNVEHPTYDPEEHCTSNNIIRHLNVKPPSERKNFRFEERKRIQNQYFAKDASTSTQQPRQQNIVGLEDMLDNSIAISGADDQNKSNIYKVDEVLRSLRSGPDTSVIIPQGGRK